MSPEFVDDRLLAAMARAGFVGLGVSPESAVDSVLAGLGKSFGADSVRAAADAVRRSGMPCLWAFLLGGPGETEQSAQETLRFAADGPAGAGLALCEPVLWVPDPEPPTVLLITSDTHRGDHLGAADRAPRRGYD